MQRSNYGSTYRSIVCYPKLYHFKSCSNFHICDFIFSFSPFMHSPQNLLFLPRKTIPNYYSSSSYAYSLILVSPSVIPPTHYEFILNDLNGIINIATYFSRTRYTTYVMLIWYRNFAIFPMGEGETWRLFGSMLRVFIESLGENWALLEQIYAYLQA